MEIPRNPEFIHHRPMPKTGLIRETVFGVEDGMVSTMGAITGIAAATHDPFTIFLSGFVIISVESVSMAVGSYLSSKSEQSINQRKLEEEKIELKQYPKEERHELLGMYIDDGWPEELAKTMAQTASQNKELFLKEMAYRELKVFPEEPESPLKNAVAMGIAYIIGGGVPLLPYILFSLPASIFLSISATLAGLFFVGAYTTRYSKRLWWKAGLEMLSLASLAALIGYAAGQALDLFFLR